MFLLAVINGNRDIVKILLAEESDLNIQDNEGKTALIWGI